MYGYEAATGLGGLAAQAPGNPYFPAALRIRDPGSMIVGDETAIAGGLTSPQYIIAGVPRGGVPTVSPSGTNVTRDPAHQLGNWREILDWHNSPAPWVLLFLLAVYGFVHISYRKGRVSAAGGLGGGL